MRRGREMQARVHFGFGGQPSAEIARVEGAKCRRECVLDLARATLCGNRACRGREMQARVRFGFGAGNPLRQSRVVEGAKRRQECVLDLARATLCGNRNDFVVQLEYAEYVGSWNMRTGDFLVQL